MRRCVVARCEHFVIIDAHFIGNSGCLSVGAAASSQLVVIQMDTSRGGTRSDALYTTLYNPGIRVSEVTIPPDGEECIQHIDSGVFYELSTNSFNGLAGQVRCFYKYSKRS